MFLVLCWLCLGSDIFGYCIAFAHVVLVVVACLFWRVGFCLLSSLVVVFVFGVVLVISVVVWVVLLGWCVWWAVGSFGGFDNAVVASGLVLLYFLVFLFCVGVII